MKAAKAGFWTPWASVRLTVLLLVLIAITVLIGAWCPQESQGGIQKVIDQFGEEWALNFSKLGITDIFHTPWFLSLIAMLTINMIACSVQRVFPKVRSLKQVMPMMSGNQICKLKEAHEVKLEGQSVEVLDVLSTQLAKRGYKLKRHANSLTAEFGKFGRLAPTVTHIGLLTLLAGVTITSWTGFGGFQPVPVGSEMNFESSEHSKLWIGKLPKWKVLAEKSWREDHKTGEVKQWFSDLAAVDAHGKVLKRGQISVNNPFSYDGVDIYQSSWGLDRVMLRFNDSVRMLQLRQMGTVYAGFLPLEEKTILIFSLRDQFKPMKVFAKTEKWPAPKLLTEVPVGGTVTLGSVKVRYEKVFPVTGLQYKCDPGLPITYIAFGFIMAGVMLAAVPHRQLWACVEQVPGQSGQCVLFVGGHSMKAKRAFDKTVTGIVLDLQKRFSSRQEAKANV